MPCYRYYPESCRLLLEVKTLVRHRNDLDRLWRRSVLGVGGSGHAQHACQVKHAVHRPTARRPVQLQQARPPLDDDGTIVTDGRGHAAVGLPDWFEPLNSDFRYQLTVIGQFSQAMVASKISHNAFAIRMDKPNVEVSWQVTGIRQNANAHRIPVEVEKAKADQGHYLYPELFDHAGEPGIIELHHPRPNKRPQQ